jgi:hypothetical protein
MIKYIHVDIYRLSVVFIFNETTKDIIKSLGKKLVTKEYENMIDEFNKDTSLGSCSRLNFKEPDIVIMLKTIPEVSSEYGVLYHELHHACRFICEDRGVECFEAEAYLFEFLVNKINYILWNMQGEENRTKPTSDNIQE